MSKIIVTLMSILLLTSYSESLAQKGIVRGVVSDSATGETIIGAIVKTSDGASGVQTDLDGQFSLSLAEGVYDIEVSFISYSKTYLEDIQVKAGEVNFIGTVNLTEGGGDLKTIVITAEARRNSENSLLAMKQKSTAMLDGISSAQFKKTGDATAIEAAKRVTGVSIDDGKYIFVRGLGDRYSKTTLGGMDIPGLDPDKNTIQLDLFPTSLLDNIVISKTFTPDLPADFTGGLVNIETKSFPEEKLFSISFGVGFNPQMNLNSDYLAYSRSSTDWLGFDDGSRSLPSSAQQEFIPTPINGYTPTQVNSFLKQFNPELSAQRETSFLNYNFSISAGNQKILKNDAKLGYFASIIYRNEYKYYDNVVYGEFQRYVDVNNYDMRYATIQQGEIGERNVLAGGLAGVAYKTRNSKVKLSVLRVQSGESRAGKFAIDNDGEAVGQSGYIASSDNLEYNERALTNTQLSGTHSMKDGKFEIDWTISPTISTSNDPDIRKTAFTLTAVDTSFIAGAGGNPSRIWRNLEERNLSSKVDFSLNHQLFKKDSKVKFGVAQSYKVRDYEILFFDIQFFGAQPNWSANDANEVLNPENLFPNSSIYYQSGNNNPNPNEYTANGNLFAGYISEEIKFNPKLTALVGVRAEKYVQRYTGRDQRYASGDLVNGNNLENQEVLNALDLFPSLNLIYAKKENQNYRISYSKTIARPSFKELSYAQILDPITNRIFNGALFKYSDWDGNLTETRINNIDARWEVFPNAGELLSISLFFKHFDNPIELVRIPEQQTSTEFQPRNVGTGQLLGVEFEFRKSLSFISERLKKYSFQSNVTVIDSRIRMTDLEYSSRKSYEKNGQNIVNYRTMAGQSPFVLNLSLNYSNDSLGIESGFYYNVKGRTLYIVGTGLFPDIYYEPFHSLNFSFGKKLGREKKSMIDFRITNILQDKVETVYSSYKADDEPFSSINPGTLFTLGYTYSF